MEVSKQEVGPSEADRKAKNPISATEGPADTNSTGDTADAVDYAMRNVTAVMSENLESNKSDTAAFDSEGAIPGNEPAEGRTGGLTSWVKNVSGFGGTRGEDEASTDADDSSRRTEDVPEEVRGSVQERAAALAADLRTPTDLTSNFRTEKPTSSIADVGVPDISNILRRSAEDFSGDFGEQAARTSMQGVTEAQDALL